MQHEIEEAFPYEETPDQCRRSIDVKADMERPIPMDRLVCGDVGYGKTEVAVRAAFKAVLDGKQVAILVPTTLLASQHGQTFRERFANYPVRVEVLSRFLTAKEQTRRSSRGVADGAVDIVIGTHRLLSDDMQFKDLGLLVVDEEQRFGVQHKERIKQLRTNVDVLTLTATPIPRTLEMSLTGIRDLSLVQHAARGPPADPHLRRRVRRPRRRPRRSGASCCARGRCSTCTTACTTSSTSPSDVRELVPEARVAVAHGQMDEGRLERVVHEFWEHEYDVLVCTTIVESGLDMPTVNTLVVDRADLLGLAQLYQLRGRVGRRGQRAYAYLFYPPDRALTEEAYERLKTIGEFTDLGSGFKIAMRDLEIRGAGNLLGAGAVGPHRRGRLRPLLRDGHRGGRRAHGRAGPRSRPRSRSTCRSTRTSRATTSRATTCAWRRTAGSPRSRRRTTSTTSAPSGRTATAPARRPSALLDVARLRAECVRLGVREVNVTKGPAFGGPAYTARVAPIDLRTSQTMRLERLTRTGVYKEDLRQLVIPVPKTPDLAGTLVDILRALVPLS